MYKCNTCNLKTSEYFKNCPGCGRVNSMESIIKNNQKIVCLVGASGSGKTTIAKELEKMGYNIIHSYTTRAEREPNEWGHTFISGWIKNMSFVISPNGKESISHKDMIAYREIYGDHYFATKGQYQNKGTGIYVVCPDGAEQVRKNVKDAELLEVG